MLPHMCAGESCAAAASAGLLVSPRSHCWHDDDLSYQQCLFRDTNSTADAARHMTQQRLSSLSILSEPDSPADLAHM